MYCPKCKGEYVPGITHCKKCQAALVNELPRDTELIAADPGQAAFVKMVPAAELTDPIDIAMIKGAMETAGINFNIRNEDLQGLIGAGFIGGTSTAVGPVYIDVNETDLKASQQVIQEYFDRQKEIGSS